MSAAVEVQGLCCAYEDFAVLSDLSFRVRKGEFFIVIGPNGSGKSTLMKAMAGLLRPKQGQISIMDRPIGRYSRKTLARSIAYLPQLAGLDFPFRVFDVVLFGRSPHLGSFGIASKKDVDLARQAMVFTHVERFSHRRLDRLSGGERQRVFIARAICQEPEIIILDEPTASLDIAHQLRIMDMMERMKAEKKVTVIMVSHDINLAAMYADTLMLINQGRLVTYGPPQDVLTYETLEAAYGCSLLVDDNPLGNQPRVTPVPGRYLKTETLQKP